MAFIDWLRDQHRTSEGRRREFNDPRLNPFQQTPHGFSARNYGSRANMPSPLVAGTQRAAPVATPLAPSPNISGGNIPFAPQFDPRAGFGVGGMGGRLPDNRVSQVDQIRAAIHERPVPDRPGSRADQWARTPLPWARDQRRENEFLSGVPEEGMWDVIIASIMDKFEGVKKGSKKIKSRIDRNRARRERKYEGGESGPGTGKDKTGVKRVYDFTPSSAGWKTKRL